MNSIRRILRLLVLGGGLFLNGPVFAQTDRVDPDSGIKTWETQAHGVNLSLTQILPDQSRAFYINRGFSPQAAEVYATACVFMTVMRNDTAADVIEFKLKDWTLVFDETSRPLSDANDWLQLLQKYNLRKSALIAFRWAQFPVDQSYQPGGDWNQGMLAARLPAGSEFDLQARWRMAGKTYEVMLEDVRCAR